MSESVEKFEFMTTVQSHVIPLFMGNKDVMCEACTGNCELYLVWFTAYSSQTSKNPKIRGPP